MARDDSAVIKKARIDQLDKIIRGLKNEERAAELSFIEARGLSYSEFLVNISDTEFDHLMDEFIALPEVRRIQRKSIAAYKEIKRLKASLLKRR